MLHSGVHPTVLGVVLGLATSVKADRYRERLQPWSNGVCVPLFVFTAVAMPVSIRLINSELTSALAGARLIGKPLGVLLGAVVALALFRPAFRLPLRHYLLAGVVASLGFSVSMLFALLSIQDAVALAQAQMGILVALCGAALVTAAVLALFDRFDADKSAGGARL
jgi:NhaA family Na+:H+ antiporter